MVYQGINLIISNEKEKFCIDKDEFIIGKSQDMCDCIIKASNAISRRHCRLSKTKDGKYGIEDLGSSNGTYINGYRLPAYTLYELNPKDNLKLADVEFTVDYVKKAKFSKHIFENGIFKAQIWGDYFSQDIILNQLNDEGITVGTYADCQMRFLREENSDDYFVKFIKSEEDVYVALCSDSVYLHGGDEIKSNYIILEPGMNLVVKNKYNNSILFFLSTELNFIPIGSDYDLYIDISGINRCSIGGDADCDIRIDEPIIGTDYIEISNSGNGYEIYTSDFSYGIKVNGAISYEERLYINNNSFFEIYGYSFSIEDNKLYTSKNSNIITKLPYGVINYSNNHLPYPKYIRNVRQKYAFCEDEIEVLAPKPLNDEEEKNLLLTMMPIILNLIIMVVLRGVMGGGGMFILYCGATMLVSGTISVITTLNELKSRKKQKLSRRDNYIKYISEKEDYIIEEREREKLLLSHLNLGLCDNIIGVKDFSNRLFEKGRKEEDYLSIRIGSGVVKSKRQISYKKEEYVETEDELKEYPRILQEKYQYMDNMPVMLNMADINAVGCIGVRSKLYQMAKNIILQFAITHFYNELKLFIIIDEEDISLFEWARWLRNTYNDEFGTRNFIYDEESRKIGLEFLYSELSKREACGMGNILEDYVVLVYRSEHFLNHPVSEYISHGKELGFRFIFFEEYEELLHYECENRIFLHNVDYSGYIQNIKDGNQLQDFMYEYVSGRDAENVALKLACVYVDEVNLENNLTKNISLFDILNIQTPYDLELTKRWNESKVYDSMRAPLGVKSGNEIVYLDVHEKYHGPHGLVAGTTGSGKSEIMQSYILSMATLYHPYDVGFVLIDFKGGGMANQFKNLPHLMGTITNMDGNEVDRSLKFIKAELFKRQEIFCEYGVNHIDDYIKLYKSGNAHVAIPHLILIVDEFAELKSEYPEFMKELISTARIGRSLGIHLILATQKPAGIVNDQIWSNSRFKLCLKVQNKNDSNEIIKSPLAAEIREPGRAYFQVGNNEIFQLFQSAYSGGAARIDGVDDSRKFRICEVSMSGKKTILYEKKPIENDNGETQLQALIGYIDEHCKQNHIPSLPDICLPPLENSISYSCEGFDNTSKDIVIPVGITDDPAKQRKYIETINFSQNNVYIIGASQSGKTNILQNIIRGLTTLYSPKEACIYIIDCGSMILRNYNNLGHVGGIVISSEDEKMANLLKLIQESIAERKSILSKKGISSYSAYRESGMAEIPQMVVILDNWIAFRNCYPDYEDIIVNMCRDCVSVGISFVVTAGQANGAGYKLISNFSKRIALYCNDSSDYTYIFEGCRLKIGNISGRGIIENNKKYYECQYYLAFDAKKEYERIGKIKEYIDTINNKYGNLKVRRIPEMPSIVDEAYISEYWDLNMCKPYEVPLGINFDNIEFTTLSMLSTPLIGFIGNSKSGKIEYIKYFLKYMIAQSNVNPIQIYIIDDVGKTLADFNNVYMYSTKQADAIAAFDEIYDILQKRLIVEREQSLDSEPLILFVINSVEAMNQMTKEVESQDKFKKLISSMENMKICVMATNVPNTNVMFGAGELIKQLKEIKKYIIFENIKDIKVYDFPPAVIREYKKQLDIGDAYYITGSEISKLKTVN